MAAGAHHPQAAHANRTRLDGRRPPLGMGGPGPPPDPSRPPDLRGPQAPVQPVRPREDLSQDRCLRFCLKSVTGSRPRPIRPVTSRCRLARLLACWERIGLPFGNRLGYADGHPSPVPESLLFWGKTITNMHILDIFHAHPTTFSFEFFPPKTDRASADLFESITQLQALRPSFVSVTYGAGGSTRERTHDLVVRIQRETDLTAVSHLTCVCHSQEELGAILDRYASSGIENILALGGVPPREGSGSAWPGFPRGIPALRIVCWKSIISSARLMPAPTTFVPSSFSVTRISTIFVSVVSWRASRCQSLPASCRSPRERTWCGWPSWRWEPASRRGSSGPSSAVAKTSRLLPG